MCAVRGWSQTSQRLWTGDGNMEVRSSILPFPVCIVLNKKYKGCGEEDGDGEGLTGIWSYPRIALSSSGLQSAPPSNPKQCLFVSYLVSYSVKTSIMAPSAGQLKEGFDTPYLNHPKFSFRCEVWGEDSLFMQSNVGSLCLSPDCLRRSTLA